MIATTLNAIATLDWSTSCHRNHDPCNDGWSKLLRHLGKTKADDDPLPLVTILDSNGLDFALWCCRCLPEYHQLWRLYAVYCARRVQHLMTDQRSVTVIDVAEKYANGQATKQELTDAYFDAAAASSSAVLAADAAYFASVAATYAGAGAVGRWAFAAANAAANAAADPDAERVAQSDAFRLLITTGELPK